MQTQLADFIKKYCAAISQFESPDLLFHRSRESAFFMPE